MECKCQNCKTNIYVGENMVMLKDDLWLSIANQSDILCDECIEKLLGRKIISADLKYSSDKNWLGLGGKIPENMLYAEFKKIKY
jgi:hypothetical protein